MKVNKLIIIITLLYSEWMGFKNPDTDDSCFVISLKTGF